MTQLSDVIWTYYGTINGVFRIFPGTRMRMISSLYFPLSSVSSHPSVSLPSLPSARGYDPSRRPWYYRGFAGGSKLSLSSPYIDAAGAGKVITLSRAVYEGLTLS
jgi:hypothetical protein